MENYFFDLTVRVPWFVKAPDDLALNEEHSVTYRDVKFTGVPVRNINGQTYYAMIHPKTISERVIWVNNCSEVGLSAS